MFHIKKVSQVWNVWVNDDHFHLWVNFSLNISALCSLCFNVSVSKANLAASPSVCSTVRRANWFRQCERTDKHRHHPPLRPHTLPCLLSLNNPSPFTPPSEEEDLDHPSHLLVPLFYPSWKQPNGTGMLSIPCWPSSLYAPVIRMLNLLQ